MARDPKAGPLRGLLAIVRENLERAEANPRGAAAHLLAARAAVTDAVNAAERIAAATAVGVRS
jgi:hypothetical protein